MRFAAPAWMALALTAGCMRFGYAPDLSKHNGGFDSGMVRPDGSVIDPVADGGKVMVGGGMDAAVRGGAGGSGGGAGTAGKPPQAGGGSGAAAIDAGDKLDAGMSDAGAMDSGATDSGTTDSGPADSGATDAGTTDSGTDSGSTDPGTTDPVEAKWTEDCPGEPAILFCDDFEDGSFRKWDYPVEERGSTAPSTSRAHTMSYSLRATTMASTATAQSKARRGVKAFGHRKSGELWARFFYYLPNTVSLTQKISVGVISEYEEPWFGFSVLIAPTGVGIERGAISRTSSPAFPRNTWVCFEMRVKIDPTEGQFEAYMNGASIGAILKENSVPAMGYTSFEIGVHYANFNQPAITAYADNVMLSTSRIGCSRL